MLQKHFEFLPTGQACSPEKGREAQGQNRQANRFPALVENEEALQSGWTIRKNTIAITMGIIMKLKAFIIS
jgi:hypothetical protein